MLTEYPTISWVQSGSSSTYSIRAQLAWDGWRMPSRPTTTFQTAMLRNCRWRGVWLRFAAPKLVCWMVSQQLWGRSSSSSSKLRASSICLYVILRQHCVQHNAVISISLQGWKPDHSWWIDYFVACSFQRCANENNILSFSVWLFRCS